MNVNIQFKINENIYLRDPQKSKLGMKIIQESIHMIDKLGFEAFTLKKLSTQINSTEASVYRYFENKHKLLSYLVSWYWEWVSFKVDFSIANMKDPQNRLDQALKVLSDITTNDVATPHIDEGKLYKIVINEGLKVFHFKNVDEENKKGIFNDYKMLNSKLSNLLLAINPDLQYAKTIANIILETAINQVYYAEHLPRLSDISYNHKKEDVYNMLRDITKKLLSYEN